MSSGPIGGARATWVPKAAALPSMNHMSETVENP